MLNRSFRVSYPAQAKMPVLHRSSAVFRERLKAGTRAREGLDDRDDGQNVLRRCNR